MATVRALITVTPEGKALAQAGLDLAGLGLEIRAEDWAPYPPVLDAPVKMWFVEGLFETSIFTLLAATVGTLLGARIRQVRKLPTDPALTLAQAQASFPLPNIGPAPGTVMTSKAGKWLHYRDFGLGAFDDDGSPGAVGPGAGS